MRDFLVSHIPDPGAVIFLGIAAAAFLVLFRMLTDTRVEGFMGEPVEHDTAPPPPAEDPETQARRRGI